MSQANVKEQLLQQLKASTASESITHQEEEATNVGAAPRFFSRASKIEVAGFLREFGILIGAEYPVVRALNLLAANTSNKNLASTVTQVSGLVQTGVNLSEAFSQHPWYFDKVTINTIRASESSGRLSEGLDYLANQYEYDQEIKDKVVAATTYPAILGIISVSVIVGMLVFIIPEFAGYLTEAGGQVEGLTAFIIQLSEFVRNPVGAAATLLAIALPAFAVSRWRRQNEVSFDTFVGRLPIVGRIMMLASLTRFVNMMHMLLANDVKMLQALSLAKGSLGNAYLRKAIEDMHKNVEQGKGLSEPLSKYTEMPPILCDMFSVGEESGKLPEMLSYLSSSMKSELNRTTDRIMVLLQPIMLIFLGGIILGTFAIFLMPYFELLTTLSQIK